MTVADATKFPANIAAVVGDLDNPGTGTMDIFEMREAFVRVLAALNLIVLHRQVEEPAAPVQGDFWNVPGGLSGNAIVGAELKVHDNGAWVDVTPVTFARAIIRRGSTLVTVARTPPFGGSGHSNAPLFMPSATPLRDGYMSKQDKAKLDGLENSADADLTVQEIVQLIDDELGSIDWRTPPILDLAVSTMTVDDATPEPGQTITVNFTVSNAGPDAAPVTQARIVLSSDTVIGTGDQILVSLVSVPAIAAGQSAAVTTTVVIPPGTSSGVRYLGVIADISNDLAETNEGNNTRYAALNIGTGFGVGSVWTGTAYINSGGNISGTVFPGLHLQWNGTQFVGVIMNSGEDTIIMTMVPHVQQTGLTIMDYLELIAVSPNAFVGGLNVVTATVAWRRSV